MLRDRKGYHRMVLHTRKTHPWDPRHHVVTVRRPAAQLPELNAEGAYSQEGRVTTGRNTALHPGVAFAAALILAACSGTSTSHQRQAAAPACSATALFEATVA